MVGEIAGRVFDHADADVADVEGAPERLAAVTRMCGRRNLAPIGYRERQLRNLHLSISCICAGAGRYRSARRCHGFPPWPRMTARSCDGKHPLLMMRIIGLCYSLRK